MARKGILTTGTDKPAATSRRPEAAPPRGAVGALQSSLTKLQENAVQDIAPDRIIDAGVTDRLGEDAEADTLLMESLRLYGQQVPVLVRPADRQPGFYEIVYGRRRLKALKTLGLTVKAMVRQLDDQALVLAQGQENTARRDLSFVEKASFAAQLDAQDYDRQTICAALTIDAPMLSRMLKVGRSFSLDFLKALGSCPGIGRDRWLAMAEAMQRPGVAKTLTDRLPDLTGIADSDMRFEQVFAWAYGKRAPAVSRAPTAIARKLRSAEGQAIAKVKHGDKALVLTIPHGDAPAFTAWVNEHAEDLMGDIYARWQASKDAQ